MIHGMMLVRNERSRMLQRKYGIFVTALRKLENICDRLVVIDDNSDDDKTVDFLRREFFEFDEQYIVNGKMGGLYENKNRQWDKNEVNVRKQLWETTIAKANHGDWIICLDADEVLFENDESGFIQDCHSLQFMLNSLPPNIDGLGFRLFDMWSMTHYRDDQHWKAHNYPWPMAVRYDANKDYVWHEKALHCGRFPANASKSMLPTMIPIRHYGWALEEDRKKKYDRYMRIDGDGKHGILAQYESILDKNPNLVEFKGV
jgi:hypothetical protein